MLLSAVSVLDVAQSSSEVPEVLMNNPVYIYIYICAEGKWDYFTVIIPHGTLKIGLHPYNPLFRDMCLPKTFL